MKTKKEIVTFYKKGNRFYRNVDFDNGKSYSHSNFQDAIFENCLFGVDFSHSNFKNTRFIDCNLKSTNFNNCDLTETLILNCDVEEIIFGVSDTSSLIFKNNLSFENEVTINKKTNKLEVYIHPLVLELYRKIPSYDLINDHTSDGLHFSVFGDLSLVLSKQIIELDEPDKLILDSFNFFNKLGDRNDKKIDNLLVVGIYEGLYWSKKCNDISRKLLKGRNKELYEYWMVHGNVSADY